MSSGGNYEYLEARGRLIDAYADGHKYVSGIRAAIYGDEDLVVGLASFLNEIGIHPVLCASGGKSGHLQEALNQTFLRHQGAVRGIPRCTAAF